MIVWNQSIREKKEKGEFNMLDLYSFLADTATEQTKKIAKSAYTTFRGIVNIVLPVVIAILLTIGIIVGVKVGIAFAKAEDEEGKKKAKNQLINIVIGF